MTCVICGEKAEFRFSPDMDIKGVDACKKHKTNVRDAYLALMLHGEIWFNDLIEGYRRQLA